MNFVNATTMVYMCICFAANSSQIKLARASDCDDVKEKESWLVRVTAMM